MDALSLFFIDLLPFMIRVVKEDKRKFHFKTRKVLRNITLDDAFKKYEFLV